MTAIYLAGCKFGETNSFKQKKNIKRKEENKHENFLIQIEKRPPYRDSVGGPLHDYSISQF